MVRLVKPLYDACHPLGVEIVTDTSHLVRIIDSHRLETGNRYCRLFAAMQGGIRLERMVAISPDRRMLIAKTEFSAMPIEVPIGQVEGCAYLGRFLTTGRLFYDPLELELPTDASAMQRYS